MIDEQPPAISVVIPTRGRRDLLSQTLDSVLSQTVTDFEIIVSNNHSADGTKELLEEYVTRDSRVRVVTPPEPLSMTGNWNFAWSHVRGRYGALLSDDDLWEPTFLETVSRVVQENPDLSVVGTGYSYLKEDDSLIGCAVPTEYARQSGEVLSPVRAVINHNLFFLNCTLFAKAVFDELGGYGPTPAGDLQLCLSAALTGKRFYYIPESLLRYRVHGGMFSSYQVMNSLIAEMFVTFLGGPNRKFVRTVRQRLAIQRAAGAAFARTGRHALAAGNPLEARQYFASGTRACPWHPRLWEGWLHLLLAPSSHSQNSTVNEG